MTIREIAKKTGLSTTTVCKALKYPSSVRRSTLSLIEEARGRAVSFNNISLVLPDLKNAFFTDFLAGVLHILSAYGIAPRLFFSNDSSSHEKEIFQILSQDPEQNIIWVPCTQSGSFVLAPFIRSQIILCDRDISEIHAPVRILMDNQTLAAQALDYLISKGARNICFINGPQHVFSADQREQGAVRTAKNQNAALAVFHADFLEEADSYQKALGILAENKYDAYLLGNQTIAMGFLKALKKSGAKDAPLCITFDNIPHKELLSYPISYIILPAFQMGERAGTLALTRYSDSSEKQIHILQGSLYLQ